MAAAYAALVSLFNNLEDIKNHHLHSFSFENNQILSLGESVSFLIEFMESYDNCHGPTKEAAQLLEMRITRAARAAEEVIESHVVDQIGSGSTVAEKPRSSRFLLDVQKVIEGMEFVKRKAIKIQKAQSGLKLKQPTYSAAAASSTPPTSEKNCMVGFDDFLLQLLDLLTGEPSSRRVIPIVGTGGIGKTTLASNAFQHPLIVQHFDVCLWVTISQQYVVEDILLKLLSRQEKSNSETVGELGQQLHKRLYGRRYLIVLDDMWSLEAWDEMKFLFPDTSNGSRVVVTTRQSDVARHLGSSCVAVGFLDDEKSWDLFCEKAFAGKGGCPAELEEVGKRIVRKCKGLPLAIVVIAGHLGKASRAQECWENVANNMSSILNSEENKHLFDILSFSYSHLPVHLKPCFVYMGTFPEDKLIKISELINLWIAEGFLKPCKANHLEEIAKDYLEDLIDRNLIISLSIYSDDHCKIHDVLRELCLKVGEKEKFLYAVDTPGVGGICRERQVVSPKENHQPKSYDGPRSTPLVHSLECREAEPSFDLRFLRVMNKEETNIGNDVGGGLLYHQQFNLRYLYYDISYHIYKRDRYLYLSSSLSLLWNLQTLIIVALLTASIIAPHEIWEMLQLRRLTVAYTRLHLPDPSPSDKLDKSNDGLFMRNLHTLGDVENLKLSEEVCKRVPNIKELQLTYSDQGRECDDVRSYYCPHNLACFHKLETLYCRLGDNSSWREFALSLTFPSSLKKLWLDNSHLNWEEITMMVGSLPHLESLWLYDNAAIGSEWNLIEGKFLRLKYLEIWHCDNLVC